MASRHLLEEREGVEGGAQGKKVAVQGKLLTGTTAAAAAALAVAATNAAADARADIHANLSRRTGQLLLPPAHQVAQQPPPPAGTVLRSAQAGSQVGRGNQRQHNPVPQTFPALKADADQRQQSGSQRQPPFSRAHRPTRLQTAAATAANLAVANLAGAPANGRKVPVQSVESAAPHKLPPPKPSLTELPKKEKRPEVEEPLEYVCPISTCLFIDPVMTTDGHTYERSCIEEWLTQNNTSPNTNLPLLEGLGLVPDRKMRRLVDAWRRKNGWA